MSPNDHAGRINKQAFLDSVLALFVIAVVATALRFLVRIRTRRTFSADDSFLLFGVACLVCALAILYVFVDDMYLVEALQLGVPSGGVDLPPDAIMRSFDFQKWAIVCLMLLWFAINAVKFSYLFLFRQLIDRIPGMVLYWRFVVIYTIFTWAFGIAAYIAPCPYFYTFASLSCSQGSGVNKTLIISSISQALDVFGDLLILAIPIRIIWVIQVRWSQKVILGFSLCLTIVIIIVTLIRASGLRNAGVIDVVWEVYWQFISPEVGLIMTALTAFRALFVIKDPRTPSQARRWYTKAKEFLKGTYLSLSPKSKKIFSEESEETASCNDAQSKNVPVIPRGTMTGVQTFINMRGRTTLDASRIMQSKTEEESSCEDGNWPLTGERSRSRSRTEIVG